MAKDFQTPYDQPACPTPSGTDKGLGGIMGGADLPDGRKETPSSELGETPFTTDVKDGAPAAGSLERSISEFDANRTW